MAVGSCIGECFVVLAVTFAVLKDVVDYRHFAVAHFVAHFERYMAAYLVARLAAQKTAAHFVVHLGSPDLANDEVPEYLPQDSTQEDDYLHIQHNLAEAAGIDRIQR